MDSKGLVTWVGAFSGALLLYAAYKGKSPLAVFKESIGQGERSSGERSGDPSGDRTSGERGAVMALGSPDLASHLTGGYESSPATYINRGEYV